MPSYREQYDKIIQAYFRDEIKPFDDQFCFCGTLSHNRDWHGQRGGRNDNEYPYSVKEYAKMEAALFSTFKDTEHGECGIIYYEGPISKWTSRPDYEDFLFEGMCAGLEVLKEIHISRGEKIDEDIPQFTKRNLSTNKIKENELVGEN